MKKFDGILICTDLDGTLLRCDGTISKENIEAIEYFKSEGGLFTFVTGRMPFFVSHIYNAVHPNAPFGCINGGGLYDFENKKYIWTAAMPDGVNELVRHIDENFPDTGIQVNTFDKVYFSKENNVMERFREITGLENLVCPYDDVKEPVAKIVFGNASDEQIEKISEALHRHPMAENFDFIRSERTLYEILPKGTGKGTAIKMLCEKLGLDKNKTVAIGDYNNDISMFKSARLGIAVSNACPEALAAADLVTVSNEEHAVARVIHDLADGKIRL